MKRDEYISFLKGKVKTAPETGFDIDLPLIKFKDGKQLKPHQRDAIVWAVKVDVGRYSKVSGLEKLSRN